MSHKIKFQFACGQKVKSKITGFTGVITCESYWINGCIQYCVKPPVDKEGKDQSGVWHDEEELIEAGEGIDIGPVKPTGGPRKDLP